MKGVRIFAAAVLGSALLATAAPASADAAAFRHYVACGTSAGAKPDHSCHKRQKKAAFFGDPAPSHLYARPAAGREGRPLLQPDHLERSRPP